MSKKNRKKMQGQGRERQNIPNTPNGRAELVKRARATFDETRAAAVRMNWPGR